MPPPPDDSSSPSPAPSRDARNALLIAAAVVAVVVLFGLLFTWAVNRPAEESVATPTTLAPGAPPTTTPLTPPTTGAPPTTLAPPAVTERVVIAELQEFVAAQRGRPFLHDVPVALVAPEDFGQQYLSSFPPGALDVMLWELQTLGVIGTGPDAMDDLQAFLTANVGGYYANNEVFVAASERDPVVDSTIVHELTHALDDQHFGLVRPELAQLHDESAFGLTAVAEGTAMAVAEAYAGSHGLDSSSADDELVYEGDKALPEYRFGRRYVRALIESGGHARIDEAFRTPPKTSKEVMESEHHLSGYTPTPVEPPAVDGEVIHEGLFGEVRFWQMFIQVLEAGEAEELASAWTGDWHVVWIDGLEQCVRVDVALESPGAATLFAEALRAWALNQEHALVEELSSGLVRLTTCAPRPPPTAGSVSPA